MYQTIQRPEHNQATPSQVPVQKRRAAGSSLDYAAGVQALSPASQPGYDTQCAALSPDVQMKGGGGGEGVQQAAAQGVSGSGGALPYLSIIQKSFGQHDVSGVSAHVGGGAKGACESIGAQAYATGNNVAFAGSPDLHTAAHEATHVVQQRTGVSLKGGVGQVGDTYEQHADAVADRVVQGESAEGLLAAGPTGGLRSDCSGAGLQRKASSALVHSVATVQCKDNGEETGSAVEEIEFLQMPARTTVDDFQQISGSVDALIAKGELPKLDGGEEGFAASKTVFADLAGLSHTAYKRFIEQYGTSGPNRQYAPDAAASMAFYEQKGVDVLLAQTQYSTFVGTSHQAAAAWLRLLQLCETRNIDIQRYEGPLTRRSPERGEVTLNEGAMSTEASELKTLVDTAAGNFQLETSTLQVASRQYVNASSALVTAQCDGVSGILAAKRAANLKKDDASEAELRKINGVISVADGFATTVNSVMGNMSTIQSNLAMWQTSFQDCPISVVVNDEGNLDLQTGTFKGPDAFKNLQSYAGSAATMGGKMIEFIFDGEIKRCKAAIAAVEAHAGAFESVIGHTEAIGQVRNIEEKMEELKTAAGNMSIEAENMRTNAVNFGVELDTAFRQTEAGAKSLGTGNEAAVGYMMEMACAREALAYYDITGRTAGESATSLRAIDTSLGTWQVAGHESKTTSSLANCMALAEERNRYRNAARFVGRYDQAVDRRVAHLSRLNKQFEEALGSQASTDGRNRY